MSKPTPVTTVSVEVLSSSLTQTALTDPAVVIQQINLLHQDATACADQARALGESATRKAILLGLKLTALKEATPHGKWENLFAGELKQVGKPNRTHVSVLLNFDIRTARRYIAVAAKLMSQRLTSEQSAVLMSIAARPETSDLTPAEASFLEEVTPEKSLRQLYLSMGIVKPTKKEAYAMGAEEDAAARLPEPPKPKRPPTLAEQRQMRKDAAREFWFGTTSAGMTSPGSMLMHLMDESRNPAESHLNHLNKSDLSDIELTLRSLLKIIKSLTA